MERPLLTAEVRQGIGKEIAKKLRAKGLIPAIFYGPRTETIPLVVNPKDFAKALQTEAGENVLIELEIHKAEESFRKVVMVKDLQIDPFQRTTLHADFYEVAMDAMVTVDIPIHLIGKAEGVKVGGILEQVQRVIQIQCLPGDIPRGIDVDVNALGIGDSIHVREIQIEKAKILSDGNLTIATVVPPVVEVEPVEEVAPEAVAEEAEAKEKKEEEE